MKIQKMGVADSCSCIFSNSIQSLLSDGKIFNFMKYAIPSLLLVSSAWAEPSRNLKEGTGGWNPSKAEVVKDPQGALFLRLQLKVDRGGAQISNTVVLEPGRNYELKIEYKSSDETSSRDRGSWIYLAFRDGQDKALSEQCLILEQAGEWKGKSIAVNPPVGAVKVYMSVRQQQLKGTFDIKSLELRQVDSEAKPIASISPSTVAALAQILDPGEKLSPEGEASPLDGNIFSPYLKGRAPGVVRDLGSETIEGVLVHKVVFKSMTVGGVEQDVFAIIARPPGEGSFPGVLWLHGGNGCAESKSAIRFAKGGYVAIAPDLPGIADPKKCPNSSGPWTERQSALGGLTVKPGPTASPFFDAIAAGLQSFDLLAAQPGVIKERIGVAGISMGGYSTTMLAGLLGERIRAAYSIYGCGFFDRGSEWFSSLRDLPDDERESWLIHFDAGRRASQIRAPYFVAAAVRDHFFWPPAVNSTLSAIPGAVNQAYAPEVSHRLTGIPKGEELELLYFAYWLKGEGQPFPKVMVESCQPQTDGGRRIVFSVKASVPVQTATLYVTGGADSWEKSIWEPIAAQAEGEGRFQAVIPPAKVAKSGAWFVNVSDARPATAGSLVYGMDVSGAGAELRPAEIASPERK